MNTTSEFQGAEVRDRSIGDLIRDARNLNAAEVEQVLSYQREHGVRFGEAAVLLGLASPDDVLNALAQQFHYPVVTAENAGKVSSELVTLLDPFSARAEAIRAVRSQLMMRLNKPLAERFGIAVVSPDRGDGKTYFASNLAVSLAQLGGRTLLVDADLRSPRVHEVFQVPNTAGLSGLLSGRTESQVIQPVESVPGLFVLPAGPLPPNPLELIERAAFGLLMRELLSKFDHVVVDTAAVAHGADACVAASRCGAAVLLARKNQNTLTALQEIAAALAGGSTQLLGTVLNEQ
ncbi:MAG: polysaccharide biosynthesis tyrosine autokinase [Roseateles sp.]|nr:MAG: polysaccharide biosynthesis tyrosine autokinase [Roseateles sp.]